MKTEPKKKVAILYSGGRYFGGIEQYLSSLFKYIDRETFEVELLSLGEWPLTKELKENGYSVKIFSGKRINPLTIFMVGRYLKKNGFNLLVSQGVIANLYARKVAFIYRIPNLVTVHSDLANDYPNKYIRTIYMLIDRLMRFITVRYIAVSKYMRKQMLESGLSGDEVDVIYNGIEFPDVSRTPHQGVVIGSVGRLHHVKGHDLLIRAFASLDRRDIRLKIAGDGPEKDNLIKLTKDLKVDKQVDFVGFQKDIYKFISGLDIYVQSSRSEGFGLAVVEAMSQELPVIVTPAGSLKEIVSDGETGFVCKDFNEKSLADVVSKVVNDYPSLDRIRKGARQFVINNFDVQSCVKGTEEAYREAMK
jgi:glycosyltransferase involved in cell wall biosynthesis